jgi:hypothetical protein
MFHLICRLTRLLECVLEPVSPLLDRNHGGNRCQAGSHSLPSLVKILDLLLGVLHALARVLEETHALLLSGSTGATSRR